MSHDGTDRELDPARELTESHTPSTGRRQVLRRWAVLAAITTLLVGWATLRMHQQVEDGASSGDSWYRCTMTECNDPGSADPDSRCPVCGMRREAVSVASVARTNAVITLDQRARELATLATEPVVRRRLHHRIRAVGTVSFDERGYVAVSARAAGTIENLQADFTGIRVDAGEELLQIYSLELLQAQNELLRQIWGFGRIPGRGRNRSVDQDLVTARHRLELMGVTPMEIDLLIERDHENPHLRVRSPISGTVINKAVYEGQWVQRGDPLFEIADLSRLWLLLDLYEEELPWLRLGQRVSVQSGSVPGESFNGTVSFIDPIVSVATRTVKVRVEFNNRSGRLKPGMFVTAHIVAQLAGDSDSKTTRLAVPREAVLKTGERSVAYVEVVPGTYRGARVTLGPLAEDAEGRHFYPVLAGLEEAQQVVTRGAFVIDSQMQIAGLPSLFDARRFADDAPPPAPVTTSRVEQPPVIPPTRRRHPKPAAAPPQSAQGHGKEDADEKGVASQPVCPVMGSPSDPSIYIDYRGVRIYFCCHSCTPKFLTDPQKFVPKLPEPVQARLREAEVRLRAELDS